MKRRYNVQGILKAKDDFLAAASRTYSRIQTGTGGNLVSIPGTDLMIVKPQRIFPTGSAVRRI